MNVCSVLLPACLYCFVCYALSVCDGYGVAIMADNGGCMPANDQKSSSLPR